PAWCSHKLCGRDRVPSTPPTRRGSRRDGRPRSRQERQDGDRVCARAGRLSARLSRSREDAAAPAPCKCTIRSPRTAARSHRPDRPDPPPTPRGLANLPSKPVQIPSPSPSSYILGTTEQESLFAPFVNPPMIPVRLKAL